MQRINLNKVEDSKMLQKFQRFDNYDEEQPSLFSVRMQFARKDGSDRTTVAFEVTFDVIEVDFALLLVIPSLLAMDVTLNHKYLTIALTVDRKYHWLQLVLHDDHLYPPSNPIRSFFRMKFKESRETLDLVLRITIPEGQAAANITVQVMRR